jgi:hypothetical protein
MKESVPHHAENHGLAPGPGTASKLWTLICFLESEGWQVLFWTSAQIQSRFLTNRINYGFYFPVVPKDASFELAYHSCIFLGVRGFSKNRGFSFYFTKIV